LEKEKKLYTKIEICNSLVSYGKESVPELVKRLGKIVDSQHKHIPEAEFRKNSYSLPRDIAARTIIRIGRDALPLLTETLKSKDISTISEAIDKAGEIKISCPTFLDDSPHGAFASRHPCRPNSIGIDILDNTPLIDIKPYIPRFDYFDNASNGWTETKIIRSKPKARE